MSIRKRRDGYSRSSIIVHWLTALIVITLFATHEGKDGDAAYLVHVGGGAIAGVFLIWRVWYRIKRGMTEKSDQAMIFNLASSVVLWGLLITILVATLTGYLVPWSDGEALDIFGIASLPSPLPANHFFHEFVAGLHDFAGQLTPILLLLHVLGAAKHAFIDRDLIVKRMFEPVSGGR